MDSGLTNVNTDPAIRIVLAHLDDDLKRTPASRNPEDCAAAIEACLHEADLLTWNEGDTETQAHRELQLQILAAVALRAVA